MFVVFFFFFKQKTAYEMRISDWSSDVCSSDLDGPIAAAFGINQKGMSLMLAGICAALAAVAGICLALTFTLTPSQIFAWVGVVFAAVMLGGLGSALGPLEVGRASCRESV